MSQADLCMERKVSELNRDLFINELPENLLESNIESQFKREAINPTKTPVKQQFKNDNYRRLEQNI